MKTKDVLSEILYSDNGPWAASLPILVFCLIRDIVYLFAGKLFKT